jgi:hypothetical protein
MTMTVLWSALATAAASVAADRIPLLQHNDPSQVGALLHTPAGLGLFGITTVLGSWAVLVASKMREGSGIAGRQRRLIQTALGAAVGACAWWLHHTLLIDIGYHNSFPGLVQHIGQFNLFNDSPARQPALAAYVLFFAALFGIRRWWWLADAFRPKRFRVGSVIVTTLAAFFIPAAFAFHQDWGVLWGTAIAMVVQLSAPWVPIKERAAVVQAPGNAAKSQSV